MIGSYRAAWMDVIYEDDSEEENYESVHGACSESRGTGTAARRRLTETYCLIQAVLDLLEGK
jgi:hypothetical protein